MVGVLSMFLLLYVSYIKSVLRMGIFFSAWTYHIYYPIGDSKEPCDQVNVKINGLYLSPIFLQVREFVNIYIVLVRTKSRKILQKKNYSNFVW